MSQAVWFHKLDKIVAASDDHLQFKNLPFFTRPGIGVNWDLLCWRGRELEIAGRFPGVQGLGFPRSLSGARVATLLMAHLRPQNQHMEVSRVRLYQEELMGVLGSATRQARTWAEYCPALFTASLLFLTTSQEPLNPT
eukprot:1157644-Pelagomonas_calceolata.AAC.4